MPVPTPGASLGTARTIDLVGSPATALFDHKANLELLTTHRDLLDPAEQTLVSQHVPETFRLTESTMERAVAERERLVCKPGSCTSASPPPRDNTPIAVSQGAESAAALTLTESRASGSPENSLPAL